MNFFVGQKVVCVDDISPNNGFGFGGLRAGAIYTIRWIGTYNHSMDGLYDGVRVTEIVRPCADDIGKRDTPYLASRFRPVKATDISIFTKILAPTPKEREPA